MAKDFDASTFNIQKTHYFVEHWNCLAVGFQNVGTELN